MKILITTDLFTVTTNGVVTSVKNLYEELDKRGHDVRILTLSEDIHSHREGHIYYIRNCAKITSETFRQLFRTSGGQARPWVAGGSEARSFGKNAAEVLTVGAAQATLQVTGKLNE